MDVLIIGASVRAAAYSAVRAGLTPWALDWFCDRDLRAVASARCIEREMDAQAICRMASTIPVGSWFYTGPVENHPDLVDALAASRSLWGVGDVALRRVRDPLELRAVLSRGSLPCPDVRLSHQGLPRDGSWLIKPLRSGGGRAIRPLITHEAGRGEEPHVFQGRIEGQPASVVALAARTGCRLIGITEQRIGRPASPFAYTGSVGPITLELGTLIILRGLIETVAAAFRLVGLFGIDFILRDGVPWPVEVNPRYTASVEVLELSLGKPLLAWHRRACEDGDLPAEEEIRWPEDAPVVGKATLFADRACRWPEDDRWSIPSFVEYEVPVLADIPNPGTRFCPGDPVCTVFARAASVIGCQAALDLALSEWRGQLVDQCPTVGSKTPRLTGENFE